MPHLRPLGRGVVWGLAGGWLRRELNRKNDHVEAGSVCLLSETHLKAVVGHALRDCRRR